MVRRSLLTLAPLLAFGALPAVSHAQGDLARLYEMTPKQGMGAQFQAALAAHAKWRQQNKDPWAWQVYEAVNGDKLGTFYARSGNHQWADFDAYDAGFGPKSSTHFGETVGPLLAEVTGSITTTDTINARWPEDQTGYVLFQVITYHLKPDKVQQFTQTVNKFHRAIVQTNRPVHYAFVSTVNGGMGPTVALVLPYKDWAGMAPPPKSMAQMMTEVYGEKEAQKAFADFSDCYRYAESAVLRLRPDLSVPGPGM